MNVNVQIYHYSGTSLISLLSEVSRKQRSCDVDQTKLYRTSKYKSTSVEFSLEKFLSSTETAFKKVKHASRMRRREI